MTWREWVLSSYSNGEYDIYVDPDGAFVRHIVSKFDVYSYDNNGEWVYVDADDLIQKNHKYFIG